MSNEVLQEYLRRVRDELRDAPHEQQDAMIAEMRAHLEDAIAARLRQVPGMTPEAAALAETRAFGEPAEIAASRRPPGPPAASLPRIPRWLLAAVATVVLVGMLLGVAAAIFAISQQI